MSVFDDIYAERARQIKKGYTQEHDDEHGVAHLLGWAGSYILRAKFAPDPATARDRLIKMAALTVAAIEAHDRKEKNA